MNTQLFTEIPSASGRTKLTSCLPSNSTQPRTGSSCFHTQTNALPGLCLLCPCIFCVYLPSLCYCSLPESHPSSFSVFFVLEMLGTESRILHMLDTHSTTEPYPKPSLFYFRIWQIMPFLSPHFKTCQHALESQSPFPNIPTQYSFSSILRLLVSSRRLSLAITFCMTSLHHHWATAFQSVTTLSLVLLCHGLNVRCPP